MRRVPITAKLLAPLALKRDRQSDRSGSMRSVTGTSVRGALAALYLQYYGQTDDTFNCLFLNEATCRFGPLDPGPKYFPLTAATCKREGVKHTLVDQLWYRIAQHYVAGRVKEDAESTWRQCKQCSADLKGHEGFWEVHENNNLCEMNSDRQHVAAHVGIDRHTATAAESILYTLESMLPSDQNQNQNQNQKKDLYGWILADDEALNALRQLLRSEDYRISVGHHRTRGYGDIRIQLDETVEQVDSQSRPENWDLWSQKLTAFLSSQPLSVPDINLEHFYFSLSFPTGAIFVDRFLRYSLDPATMLSWLSPMSPVDDAFPIESRPVHELSSGGTMQWIATVTKHERLRGWNAAHGLPRQDEWGVARGSVYVYCFQGTMEQREVLIQYLSTLSKEGVGLRRNEGFGTVVISDDFHYQFRNQQEI